MRVALAHIDENDKKRVEELKANLEFQKECYDCGIC